MNILHVSFSSSSADGGISTAVSQLVDYQRRSAPFDKISWLRLDELCKSFLLFHYIYILLISRPDIIHIHGLWRLPSRLILLYNLLSITTIVSPHGMLHPMALQFSGLKKKFSFLLFEKHLLTYAKAIHALNEYEAHCVNCNSTNSKISIIPNGVCCRQRSRIDCREILSLPADSKILLYFGRYHSGKNIDLLARSWEEIHTLIDPSWWLVFVGHGDGLLLDSYRNSYSSRIKVFGPFYDEDKHTILSSVSAFILPSAFEALPMAALEAMSYSLPCLLTDQCNLTSAFDAGAAYRISLSSLSKDLLGFFSKSFQEFTDIGVRAHALVSTEYSWERISELFLDLYRSHD